MPSEDAYYLNVRGYFNAKHVYDEVFAGLKDNAKIVEVGCWLGQSVCYLAGLIKAQKPLIKFFAVDTFRGSPEHQAEVAKMGGSIYSAFMRNISGGGYMDFVTPIAMASTEAAQLFQDGTCDYVFIDADHKYESVKSDIAAWLPKVKAQGILAGDDYHPSWPGVMRAVDEYFGTGSVRIAPSPETGGCCWMYTIPVK